MAIFADFRRMGMLADPIEPAQFLESGAAALCRGLPEHQRGARWSVDFVPMMHFQDLNVPIGTEAACRLFNQLFQHVDPERRIGRVNDRDLLCGLFDPGLLFRLQPRRSDKDWKACGDCTAKAALERGRRGKIDQNVRMKTLSGLRRPVRSSDCASRAGFFARST